MTNDELRIAIAKAKGWKLFTRDRFGESVQELYYSESGKIKYAEQIEFQELDVEKLANLEYIPDWPNEIAAAWELFDELPVYKSVECARHDGRPKPVIWECHVNGVGNFLANTAPVVICLAWLAWKEGQE